MIAIMTNHVKTTKLAAVISLAVASQWFANKTDLKRGLQGGSFFIGSKKLEGLTRS
ncbi:hypothetical protein [Urinicoccus massiliensis]|uniref:hypothetical protein n=1 Tax=Urinicoccus massiliensis TaxID=1723382 RepID=UPI0015D673B0|nr:hypothetical protein [Urinicoccus massiliensis]